MEIVWSESAEKDLDAIVNYIADDNLHAALEVDELVREAVNGLAKFPRKGKPGRVSGTRELIPHPNYVLVYQFTEERVQVIAVLHTSRQWPAE